MVEKLVSASWESANWERTRVYALVTNFFSKVRHYYTVNKNMCAKLTRNQTSQIHIIIKSVKNNNIIYCRTQNIIRVWCISDNIMKEFYCIRIYFYGFCFEIVLYFICIFQSRNKLNITTFKAVCVEEIRECHENAVEW